MLSIVEEESASWALNTQDRLGRTILHLAFGYGLPADLIK